jgi:hypothetical protein
MPGMKLLTLDRLREVLDYEHETGLLRWKVRLSSRAGVGDEAGTIGTSGYLAIGIDGKIYRAHRLAWFHFYGRWPEKTIDHIDANRTNNKISNLRDASCAENRQNQHKANIDSATGVKGVFLRKDTGMYEAKIGAFGKVRYLGSFRNIRDASDAYVSAAAVMHTHNPSALQFACADD